LNTLRFEAVAHTVGDDPACCQFTWRSSVDGALGGGAGLDVMFPTRGPRVVTVTAKTADGRSSEAEVPVQAVNLGPAPSILSPGPVATLYRGHPYKLQGTAGDPNDLYGIACSALEWFATPEGGPTTKIAAGCQPSVTFATNGKHALQLRATDPHGVVSSTELNVYIVDPPLHAPPLVTILEPDAGAFLDPYKTIQLVASATDADGGGPVTGTWSVRLGSETKPIGPGNTRSWRPADHVPFFCGGAKAALIFTASDADGTEADEIDIKVDYPAC
jgi:hypothetical protein